MALKLNERYPGRFDNPSAGYPQGAFKNRTTPTAKDGSYLEKDWANDKEGLFQSLLSEAGVAPDGTVDAVGSSQYYAALLSLIQTKPTGRMLRQTIYAVVGGVQMVSVNGSAFTSVGANTFTPHPNAASTEMEGVGGGGSGGGCGATGASQASDSVGGTAGGYVRRRVVGVVAAHPVTVGRGGASPAAGANNGNSGTTTSFGAICSATGGTGGLGFAATSSFPAYAAPTPGMPAGTGVNGDVNGVGGLPSVALLGSSLLGQIISSAGGPSHFGSGGVNTVNTVGSPGLAPGSGGSGVASAASSGSNSGGKGADGIAIYREYA